MIPLDHLLTRMARDPTLAEALAYFPSRALGPALWDAVQRAGWIVPHPAHGSTLRDGTAAYLPHSLSLRALAHSLARALCLVGPIKSFRWRGETHDFYNLGRPESDPQTVVFLIPKIRPRHLPQLLDRLDRPDLSVIVLLPTWDLTTHTTETRVQLAVLGDLLTLSPDGTLHAHPLPRRPLISSAPPPPLITTPLAQTPPPPDLLDSPPAEHPKDLPPTTDPPACTLYSPQEPFGRPLTRPEALAIIQDADAYSLVVDASRLGRTCAAWVRGRQVELQPGLARVLALLMRSGRPMTAQDLGCNGESGIKRVEQARRLVDPRDGDGWAWFRTEAGRRYRFACPDRWALLDTLPTTPQPPRLRLHRTEPETPAQGTHDPSSPPGVP